MPKVIEGYVLDRDSAAPIAGVPVTLFSAIDNHQIVSSEAFGLTANPTTTDANGHFKISMDLSPGPVYVDAFIASTQHRRRYGLETMQLGDHWLTDIGTLTRAFSDGVIAGVTNQMAVTVSGVSNQFTVAKGMALIQGYTWTLESGTYTASIAANTTQANRHAYVVLRQYTGGPQVGKQEIGIIYGASSGADPVVKQNVTVGSDVIWEFPLARLNTALNASVSTILADLRAYSNLGLTIFDGGVPVVGSARGLDFAGSNFVVTDEGGGTALITPSFGTGAGDFKRGNAQTDGIRRGYINSNSSINNIGNSGEVEITHLDIPLDPTVTYDAVVDGAVHGSVILGLTLDFDVRVSLDVPYQSAAPTAGSMRATDYNPSGVASTPLGTTGFHQWTYRGISGVSTIRAYLFVSNAAQAMNADRYMLSAKFFSRS